MFNSILIPVDGSKLSYKPIHAACALAKLTSGRLIVISVAEPRMFNGSDLDSIRNGIAVEAANLNAAKSNVQKIVDFAEGHNVPCEAVVSMSRLPEEEILKAAEQYQCDVILMATRGKLGVIDTIFKESLTQEVLRKSSVPVLVFP